MANREIVRSRHNTERPQEGMMNLWIGKVHWMHTHFALHFVIIQYLLVPYCQSFVAVAYTWPRRQEMVGNGPFVCHYNYHLLVYFLERLRTLILYCLVCRQLATLSTCWNYSCEQTETHKYTCCRLSMVQWSERTVWRVGGPGGTGRALTTLSSIIEVAVNTNKCLFLFSFSSPQCQ